MSLKKRFFISIFKASGIDQKNIDLLVRFYGFYGHKCKAHLFWLFIGAIVSGVIEIFGLILLYILIRLLIDIKSFGEDHIILRFFSFIGIEDPNMMIPFFGGSILFIFVLKNIYTMIYYHLQHLLLRRWKFEISTDLMNQYLNAPYVFLLKYNSATIIRNVNATVGSALNGFVLGILNYFSNIIAGMIIISLLCLRYVEVTLAIAVILVLMTLAQNRFLKKKQIQLGKEKEELATEQTKTVYQGLHALKETKVVGKEAYFVDLFRNINKRTINNEMKAMWYQRLPSHLTEITVIVSILLITMAVLMDTAGNVALSVSSLGVLGGIAFRMAPIMNRIISSQQAVNKNHYPMFNLFKEIDKLNKLKKTAVQIVEAPAMPFERQLEMKNISFQYPTGSTKAVEEVSFGVKKGEFVGIVGSSGAGKTTLVDIMLGLLTPSSGEILVDGQAVTKDNIRSWQKNIGYVPQSVYMGEVSIAENIAFGIKKKNVDRQKVRKVIEDVRLADYVDNLANGIDYNVGEGGKNLSGGQKQRLGIARALYLEADVLILDEATSALDVPTETKISEAINSIRGDKTIVVIAHRLSTIFNADKIIFLEGGKVVDIGTYDELFQRNPAFNQLATLARVTPEQENNL